MSLRLFVTTDNHVGFDELDPVRGSDAANSFEEAMSIADARNVDLVIQGGDLFHKNKPSKNSMYSVMKTLRRFCLNDKPIEFQVLNHGPLALTDDPASPLNHLNYEDPNFNVGLPVFAISGNHDDVGGSGGLQPISPLDILSMSGLINHFGRIHDATDIVVTPILIEKQGIRLALYGMASVRDERLYRTFRDNKVKFLRPKEDPDSWYNILVVHQNHAQHGPTNFLPEQFLPNFMDLIIWGHEHECLIDPVENPNKGFKVMQPGSTVATSLSDSELKPKHVGIITLLPNKVMTFEKIRLNTVRPFAMATVSLAADAPKIKPTDREVRAKVTSFLMDKVEELIDEANQDWQQHHRHDGGLTPLLPLIRLRVDYSGGYEVENTTRFSNRFVDRVANSNDILHLIKRRQTNENHRILPKTTSASSMENNDQNANGVEEVGKLVREYLTSEHLNILLERGMSEALTKFVEKDDKIALKVGVDSFVKQKVAEILESEQPPSYAARESRRSTEPLERIRSSDGDIPSRPASTARAARSTLTHTPVEPMDTADAMEIDESDPDDSGTNNMSNNMSKKTAARPSRQTFARPKRVSRKNAQIETPLPIDADSAMGDDSDEMFSSEDLD